jgi:hypothetical protein
MMMQQRYRIPRFHNPDLVILSHGMVTLTVRQFTILLVAGLIAANLWPSLSFFALLPAILVLPFGWVAIAHRPLEVWLLVLLRYWFQPRLYTWQPIRASKKEEA